MAPAPGWATVVVESVMGVQQEVEVLPVQQRRRRQVAVVEPTALAEAAPRLVGRRITTPAVPSALTAAGRRTAVPGNTETGHPTESRAYGGRLCSTPPDSSATTGTWSYPWHSSTTSGLSYIGSRSAKSTVSHNSPS